ncbi:P-loop containing nucleoside triphosphate hydrolase protein [Testicularia cyperi]|uniref:Kinesin-like protein n=1 Tax=Testicularia cyperi TaxID=1882483 RepID=A0A317XPF0_9BASI|nr:P-loop containing nucleoside triphosphate hydrolase protein [Testicularia cyperi]
MQDDFAIVFRVRSASVSVVESDSEAQTVAGSPMALVQTDSTTTALVHEPKPALQGGIEHTTHTFTANHTYGTDSTTENIFTNHVEPLVPFVLRGGYATVMAYGQTGSGKTYTLSHCSQLAVQTLYRHNASLPAASRCKISLSAVEIYGKKVNDLLDLTNTRAGIAENMQGASVFMRAKTLDIATEDEMLRAIEQAWSCRRTSATEKNEQSSRSHALVRLTLQSLRDKNALPGVLQLVDLAGSERASDDSKNHSSERMAETVAINTSLMTLKECIRSRALAGQSDKPPHIPFRSSKLTLALKEAFDLYSRQPSHTLFFATASPCRPDIPATINTFRYASQLLAGPKRLVIRNPDPRDIFHWSNERVLEWLTKYGGPQLARPRDVAPYEDGASLSRVPEGEFIQRLEGASNNKLSTKAAREIYLKWWKLVIASRTLAQTAQTKEWKDRRRKQEEDELDEIAQDATVQQLAKLLPVSS